MANFSAVELYCQFLIATQISTLAQISFCNHPINPISVAQTIAKLSFIESVQMSKYKQRLYGKFQPA